jgi:hypothetical protein
MALLNWLEATSYSQWILVSAEGWPLMLSLHAFGLAIIVGVVFSLNLRILGLYETIPYTSLHSLMGIAWIGIAINIFTGLSIFFTQASSYITNVPFLFKILFIVLGIVNLVYARKILRREAAAWDAAGSVPRIGTMLAASSLLLWILAVVTGRLIAYL